MNPYPRRNPVLFKRRTLWQRGWIPLAFLALAISQKSTAIRLADALAGVAAQVGAGRKTDHSQGAQEERSQWEIWSLRQEIDHLKALGGTPGDPSTVASAQRLNLDKFTRVFATVIARDPADWASFIWIEAPTEDLAQTWIEAPVIVGDVAIGMVDFAHRRRCRVRLLTDAQLSLSVTTPANDVESSQPMWGQVRGLGGALWSSSGSLLLGEGYLPGPPRFDDGDPKRFDNRNQRRFAPQDLLVTSGLDGIFPPNLRVGIVDRVESNERSSTRYEFSANSALDLHRLENVWVLIRS